MVEVKSKGCVGGHRCMRVSVVTIFLSTNGGYPFLMGVACLRHPHPVFVDAFLLAVLLCVVAHALDSEEAITADMEVRWMGGIIETHTFVKWCAGFVPRLRGLTEGGTLPLSFVICSLLSGGM